MLKFMLLVVLTNNVGEVSNIEIGIFANKPACENARLWIEANAFRANAKCMPSQGV